MFPSLKLQSMNNITDINIEFIENSIGIGIKLSEARERGKVKYVNDFSEPYGNDLTNIYFAGQGLYLDVKDAIGTVDIIKLNWEEESFGYFSGGPRRLLSLKALRKLQVLMDLNGINYEPKEMLL